MNLFTNQEDRRDRLTREALADVDAGRVVDHRVVQNWLKELQNKLNWLRQED